MFHLNRVFSEQRQRLADVLTRSYGTAYQHALTERAIRVVAEGIGMKWPVEGITSSVSLESGLKITLTQVIEWMHTGTPSSFKNIRNRMTKCRRGLDVLKHLEARGRLDAEDRNHLAVLKAFLLSDIIADPLGMTGEEWAEGEHTAATMKKVELDNLLKKIAEKHSGFI
jgi:hypothetical protein